MEAFCIKEAFLLDDSALDKSTLNDFSISFYKTGNYHLIHKDWIKNSKISITYLTLLKSQNYLESTSWR